MDLTGATTMKRLTSLLLVCIVSQTAHAQFPIGRPEAVSSSYYGSPSGLEYRRQMAEQRRRQPRSTYFTAFRRDAKSQIVAKHQLAYVWPFDRSKTGCYSQIKTKCLM